MDETINLIEMCELMNAGIFIQDVSDCAEPLGYYFPQETEDYPYNA